MMPLASHEQLEGGSVVSEHRLALLEPPCYSSLAPDGSEGHRPKVAANRNETDDSLWPTLPGCESLANSRRLPYEW